MVDGIPLSGYSSKRFVPEQESIFRSPHLDPTYIKLLDFADFAVQAANSRIGPFSSRVLNLTR